MLEPLVVKATRAVPRRERRSNPPDLSNEVKEVIPCPYQTLRFPMINMNAPFKP